MKADAVDFSFLNQPQVQFIIPFFQRAYVWDEENWGRLLESLNNKTGTHFLGSVILKNEGGGANKDNCFELSVIDGQQRLTTISLLLRAIYDKLDAATQIAVQDQIFIRLYIKKDFVKGYDYDNIIEKLVPGYHDYDIYKTVILDPAQIATLTDEQKKSSIVRCYEYFCDKLSQADALELYKTLCLTPNIKFVVKIDLDQNDNEQAIFDVTNATGVPLSCADIIKNDLFNRLDKATRKAIYESTWELEFEESTVYDFWHSAYGTRLNIENLLFAVAHIENRPSGKPIFDSTTDSFDLLSQRYRSFFDEIATIPNAYTDFVNRLIKYGKIYNEYLTVESGYEYKYSENIKCHMLSFNRLGPGIVLMPYLLKLFDANSVIDAKGEINLTNEPVVTTALKSLERLLVRAAITKGCQFLDSKYKPSFKNFNKTIHSVLKSGDMKELFTAQQLVTINDDAKVKEGLKQIDNTTAALILFVLNLKLVDSLGAAAKPDKYAYNYELEHIMPQHFDTYWGLPTKDVLGNPIPSADQYAYRQAHVYEIGNMTILNPKVNKSIKNFVIKIKYEGDTSKKTKAGIRQGYKGYQMCAPEPISKDFIKEIVSSGYVWSEEKIEKRTMDITNDVLAEWK